MTFSLEIAAKCTSPLQRRICIENGSKFGAKSQMAFFAVLPSGSNPCDIKYLLAAFRFPVEKCLSSI